LIKKFASISGNRIKFFDQIREVYLEIDLLEKGEVTVTAKEEGGQQSVDFFVPSQNKTMREVSFPAATQFLIHIGRTFKGILYIKQGSKKIEIKVGGFELKSDEPIKINIRAPRTIEAQSKFLTSETPSKLQRLMAQDNARHNQLDNIRSFDSSRPPGLPPTATSGGGESVFIVNAGAEGSDISLKEGFHSLTELSSETKDKLLLWVWKELLPNLAGTYQENKDILKDFNAKFYIKTIDSKKYMIFKGPSALRNYIKEIMYTASPSRSPMVGSSPQVMALIGGGDSALDSFKSGIKSGVKSTFGNVFLYVAPAIDLAEWLNADKDSRDPLPSLLAGLTIGLAEGVLTTAITAAITSGLAAGLVALGVGVAFPVWATVLAGVAIGMAVGLAVAALDDALGLTPAVKKITAKVSKSITDKFQEFTDGFARDVSATEKWIVNRMIPR